MDLRFLNLLFSMREAQKKVKKTGLQRDKMRCESLEAHVDLKLTRLLEQAEKPEGSQVKVTEAEMLENEMSSGRY